jgi:ferripyoverdine receptor
LNAQYKFIGLSICLACSLYAVDANLGEVTAYGKADLSTTEGTGSYTTGNMSTATGLNLSIRQTPQSVSVVSNQLIKDLNLKDVDTAMNYASGITLYRDSGRDRIVSRGFNIDNIQEDGVASSVSITAQGTLGFSKEFTDLEFYDRVEVLRGVVGLTQSNGEPGGTVNLVRKRPGDELGVNLGLSMGSWNNYRGSFDVTDALNTDGTIRGRLIGILNKTGSFKNHKKRSPRGAGRYV